MTLPPNTPLSAENVGLLKPGDVLLHTGRWLGTLVSKFDDPAGVTVNLFAALPHAPAGIVDLGYDTRRMHVSFFTYIGPDLGDGWIGWSGGENPVPGAWVRVRFRDGSEGEYSSDAWTASWHDGQRETDIIAFRPALSPPAEGEVLDEKADVRQALDLALAYLGQFEPTDSRAVSNEYVAMLMAGTEDHNDEGRKIIRDALARIEANPLPPIVAEVTFSDPDTPAPVDHIGDATEKIDWARCQRCGGEIQGWICQDCHQEFEENDAGELVFCPSEAVDWQRVGPKLVEAIEDMKSAADSFRDCEADEVANQVILRADIALAAAQPEGK